MDKTFYVVADKETGEYIGEPFPTENAAQVWCEEQGVDYDYFEILEV